MSKIKKLNERQSFILKTVISISITVFFAAYNLYLGIAFSDSWGLSISIYYLCLLLARISTLIIENKIAEKDDLTRKKIRRASYIALSSFMFFIDFCLMAPISLMVVYPKDFAYGLIPSLVIAAYTTYKITMSIINYIKVKKIDNLLYRFLRELNLIDALVSILSLQHTLIMVNGGMTHEMLILSSISSLAIVIGIIIFSILSMKHNLANK